MLSTTATCSCIQTRQTASMNSRRAHVSGGSWSLESCCKTNVRSIQGFGFWVQGLGFWVSRNCIGFGSGDVSESFDRNVLFFAFDSTFGAGLAGRHWLTLTGWAWGAAAGSRLGWAGEPLGFSELSWLG